MAEGGRALIVTSSNPGEGKTTTVANLAVSLAANGAKVLVVDADLRRPTLHQHFGIAKTPGLSDLIVGKCQTSEAIQSDAVQGACTCCPAATSRRTPPSSWARRACARSSARLKTRYDWVLIDTPPVLAMADTPVLCPFVDGVILVVASEASSRPAVQRAIDQLSGVGGQGHRRRAQQGRPEAELLLLLAVLRRVLPQLLLGRGPEAGGVGQRTPPVPPEVAAYA